MRYQERSWPGPSRLNYPRILLALVALASQVPTVALGSVIRTPDEAEVVARISDVMASDPKIFQQIPWVGSLGRAIQLSQIEQRPVFLFTHDGNMNTGRC